MSQHFKSKYDQMRENSQSTDPESQNYGPSENGPVRNICFVLEDGSQQFLNYGYLISGNIDAEKEKIILSFTSHEVELDGSNLQDCFDVISQHIIKVVTIADARYKSIETSSFFVRKIKITQS